MNKMQQLIRKNHMDISWHEYTDEDGPMFLLRRQVLQKRHPLLDELGLCYFPVELVPGGSEVL